MPNQVTAEINFLFSGRPITLSATLDLDRCVKRNKTLSNKMVLKEIARVNGISTEGELFQAIQLQDVSYSKPMGCAIQFNKGDKFDFLGFKYLYEEHATCEELIAIVRSNMNIESLDEVEGLEQTLLDICDVFKRKSAE